jgi:SAM-dependent methyltransferase
VTQDQPENTTKGLEVSEPLKRHYDRLYDGPREGRRLGAIERVATIVSRCSGYPHGKILELGCGEGSVLARMAEVGFGQALYGLDISRSGIEAVARRGIGRLVECKVYDGYNIPYPDAEFDLAVLTHVVEHLEYPRRLLREAARVARYVFVQVPLQDNVRLPGDYAGNKSRKINVYSEKTIRGLVQTCDLEILFQDVLNYSRAFHVHLAGRARGVLFHYVKRGLLRLMPSVAKGLFTYNSAILCRRRVP